MKFSKMKQTGEILNLLHFLIFYIHLSAADTHSVQFLYTAITPGTHLPEFTAVGLVDGEQFVNYDSKISEPVLKSEWKEKIKTTDPHYQYEINRVKEQQDWFRDSVAAVMKIFNHTEGVHTFQRMFSCECDDNRTIRGYDQYGYDGEDFFRLNLKTGSWTAVNDKAEIFIKKWDPEGEEAKYCKNYLWTDCIDWLYKIVFSGRKTLERKVRPEVSLFHKHSPSPEVVCHATGFFPKAVMITWQKEREKVHEDVEIRETLPNQDGSFQKRSILKVPAEELQKHNYTCVVQHSSLEKDLVLEVPKVSGRGRIGIILAGVLGLTVLIAVVLKVKVKEDKEKQRRRSI